MIIVIPMAGRSKRFTDAGYGPKHMLPLGGVTMFDWAASGFCHYPDSEFIFVTNSDESDSFVRQHAAQLGIPNINLVRDESMRGYGAAAFNGLSQSGINLDQPVIISPVDTFRFDFELPSNLAKSGFMEMCIMGAANEDRLNGFVRKPWLLKEPPQANPFL